MLKEEPILTTGMADSDVKTSKLFWPHCGDLRVTGKALLYAGLRYE